jgi:hypothetical protein
MRFKLDDNERGAFQFLALGVLLGGGRAGAGLGLQPVGPPSCRRTWPSWRPSSRIIRCCEAAMPWWPRAPAFPSG